MSQLPTSGRGRGMLLLGPESPATTSSEDSPVAPTSIQSRGRGMILRGLEAAATTSSEESRVPLTSVPRSQPSPILDSGISLSMATGSPIMSGGRGGRMFDQISISSKSSQSTDDVPVAPVFGGRGKLLLMDQYLKELKISSPTSTREENDAQAGGDGLARPVVADVVVPEIEEEEEIVLKRGKAGTPTNILTNYIRLFTDPNKGVFEYEVRYDPNVHSSSLRHQLINQHKDIIGNTKTFDGTTLYLPFALKDRVTEFVSVNKNDESQVKVMIIFKKKKRLSECIQLYNVLFDRIMKTMEFVRFGRKRFDPSAPKIIPQHKLEVWPGYVTAVDEYEDGVMLCLDASHRVLCQSTVLDLMRNAYRSDKNNFQTQVMSSLLGAVVLTRYNNCTYRIDDVKFDTNPMDSFEMNGKLVTYVDYYKSQYNIDIQDKKQPLLIHHEERRIIGKTEKETITFCLIPEICYLTGLTDEMRKDFKVMRDIATFTRVTPNQRLQSFRQFCENLDKIPAAKEILTNWGLTLDKSPLPMVARQLEVEQIAFKDKSYSAGPGADFSKYVTSNEILEAIDLRSWIVIHTKNDTNCAQAFVELMGRNSKPMGISVARPAMHMLENDRTEMYIQALRKLIVSNVQIIVVICPTSRDDRYAAIKKVCCAELPIPSQVINARTLSNDAKNRAIVQKIALQMNCKMGGTLWSIRIPFKNVMICGVDTYHDAKKKENSVSAFVASLNGTFTRWYSRAVIQKPKEELINGMCFSLQQALGVYENINETLPDKIVIYRDGVGDGQLTMCKEYEVPQLLAACQKYKANYKPLFTFIVVQKRINTRIFAVKGKDNLENPLPGCVLDHTIMRRNMFDFFLVPQSVRQGSVSPTHYIVVYDTSNFAPDILQRLSYKLCFLYYNWPGTVRVPACCQYAHKLAFLVGQSIKRTTAEVLQDKLFYL